MNNLRPLIADDFQNILQDYVNSMPTFSPATAKIIQLANMLNPPANEIVSSIRLDPVLTGKVLQLANSAYFSLAQRVTSLNRALVYLGINTIKNLALSTAVMEAFETRNKELKELVKPTWNHSLSTAICAKGLAKLAGVEPLVIEEYFIMGLLHDLGKTTMMQAFFKHLPHYGELSLEEENKNYGLTHPQVGANTLKKWKFSDDIVQAVRDHHDPKTEHKQTHLLHLANCLTYELHLNGKEDPNKDRVHPINANSWKILGIKKEDALKELSNAQDQIQKAEVFLNIATSKDIIKETP
jgi:putative nucleotidyltransferase with HDIG domain